MKLTLSPSPPKTVIKDVKYENVFDLFLYFILTLAPSITSFIFVVCGAVC